MVGRIISGLKVKVRFAKYHGAGNDFILIDDRQNRLRPSPQQIAAWCDRHRGVGADGLILVRLPQNAEADLAWDFYNSDGSQAEMCGNGARCLASFARDQLGVSRDFTLETIAGLVRIRLEENDQIAVRLTPPTDLRLRIQLPSRFGQMEVHHLNTGVPHTVLFVGDVDRVDVVSLGREIRYHQLFAPAGTNVNFAQHIGPNLIRIRTYERGVEGETLACGTGVTASALIASKVLGFQSPVRVRVQSGDELAVRFVPDQDGWKEVELIGPAVHVFDGEIEI